MFFLKGLTQKVVGFIKYILSWPFMKLMQLSHNIPNFAPHDVFSSLNYLALQIPSMLLALLFQNLKES
jgi:hypothetical protein